MRNVESNWIVVYSLGNTNDLHDHWIVFDNLKDAEDHYNALLKDVNDLYTASMTKVVKSTDYNGEEDQS